MIINSKLIAVAFMFILFDVVTGLLSACITGTFQSSIMKKGGKSKLFLLVAIVFGLLLDYAQHITDLGFSIPACHAICIYIIMMEIMSCVENFNKAIPGVLPKPLTKMLYSAADSAGVDHSEEKKEE